MKRLFAILFLAVVSVQAEDIRVLILLMRYPNTSGTFSAAQAQANFTSTTAAFYQNASYNQATITAEAHGWYVLPCTRSTCEWEQLDATATVAAIAEGVNVASFSHRYYMIAGGVPDLICSGSPCGVLGTAWDAATITSPAIQIHEFGHSLGLGHGDIGPIGGGGIYGSDSETLLSAQRYTLGWLDAPPITVSGQYPITSVEQFAGQRSYSIVKSDGTKYFLDYRQSYYGVPVLYVESDGYYTNVMLDPCGGLGQRVGRSYYDATERILVTLNSGGLIGSVSVAFDSPPPQPCAPSPTPTPTPTAPPHGRKK